MFAAPAIIGGVFALTFLLALPLALTMRGLIETQLGRSTVAESVAGGANYDWWQEFTSQATGLGTTFTPTIIGFAATLDNISSLLDGQREIVPVASALAVYLAGWLLISGGIVDRYARQRPTRAHGFFAAGGVFFFRFLRLAVAAAIVYWWLFTYVHAWLFVDWYPRLTRDLSVERNAFVIRTLLYALFGALLAAANLLFDYTRIRLVVEDRRSVFGALAAAVRFIARRPGPAVGLYALNAAMFALTLAVWAVVAPGARGTGGWIWIAFAAGQFYIVARLLLKLHFLASQTALFQASLAHARYTATPAPVWPESPMAEMTRPT